MKIKTFDNSHIRDVVALWNKNCGIEMPYKPFTEEGFRKKFIDNLHFTYDSTFVCWKDGKIIAFANGLYIKEFLPGETFDNTPGYLTFILVDKNYRRRGYGKVLLEAVKNYFKTRGKSEIHLGFFNPINLEWYLPGLGNYDHPNAPGVAVDGPGYGFLESQGYKTRGYETSMYLDLVDYEPSKELIERINSLRTRDIIIEYYDENRHHGFDKLFDSLEHEHWRKGIKDNLARQNPLSILVASHNGRICGYTGPIDVEPSGRGWFDGIGVDPKYSGIGVGSALFLALIDNFREMGAKFSSIYVGTGNPARKIYEKAGFLPIKTWAVMTKEI